MVEGIGYPAFGDGQNKHAAKKVPRSPKYYAMPVSSIRECPPSFVGVEHAVEPLVKLGHLSCPAFHVAAPQSRPMDFLPDRAGQDSEGPHPGPGAEPRPYKVCAARWRYWRLYGPSQVDQIP
ncbi:hypothetical protein M431DRAFT_536228 [Trichoderma harzianum CBS 226.95]|uniref:Uncharacterized protein n=1 Tax=Trichoderma harzianum CBS 226.95 TaxID=983964 RepID=A0A2T3ZRW8_TRIHA|nr:hypothetical protein M431DRAFT_536228 [Trichoderma harzianum CBS 226.95]PTB47532.1 hypothetical protein M431DRAFT_536228 [Trichoderma harzianum CBS 226.95]